MNDLTENKIDSKQIYKGTILDLYCDSVRLPNGNTGKREYIRHVGAACVVPLTKTNEVLLVNQFRYPFGAVLSEIPAGKLDSPDEPPLEAAKRELREETGAEASEIIYLGEYYPTCAYSNEVIHMFLALDVSLGTQHLDEDEFIRCDAVPLEEYVNRIMAGEIKDGKTQTAILKAYYYLKNK